MTRTHTNTCANTANDGASVVLALGKLESGTAGMVYAYALELFIERVHVAEEATGMKFICEPEEGAVDMAGSIAEAQELQRSSAAAAKERGLRLRGSMPT